VDSMRTCGIWNPRLGRCPTLIPCSECPWGGRQPPKQQEPATQPRDDTCVDCGHGRAQHGGWCFDRTKHGELLGWCYCTKFKPKLEPEPVLDPCGNCGHAKVQHTLSGVFGQKMSCLEKVYRVQGHTVQIWCNCTEFRAIRSLCLRYALIEPGPTRRRAARMGVGAHHDKDGVPGWKTRSSKDDSLQHLIRHLLAYMAGDRSEDHMAAVGCRADFVMHFDPWEELG